MLGNSYATLWIHIFTFRWDHCCYMVLLSFYYRCVGLSSKFFFFFFNKSTSTLPLKYLCFRSTVYILNYTLGYIFWLLHMGNCFSLFNLKVSFKTFWWMIIINAAKWWIWGSKHKSVMFRWTWAVHCLEIEFTIELCSCYSSKHMEKKFFFL